MEASDLGPREDAPEEAGEEKEGEERSKTWLHLLQRVGESVAPVLLTAGGFVGFLAFAGSIIVWTRFQAAEVPPDQVVAAYPQGELVAVASALLLIFGFVGVLAVLGFFLINRKGGASIGVSRGLLGLLAIEGMTAILLVDTPWSRDKVLAAELFLLPLFVAFWATFAYERKEMSEDTPGAKAPKNATLTRRAHRALHNAVKYLLHSEFVNRTLLGTIAVTILSLLLVAFGVPAGDVALVALALIGLVPSAWLIIMLVDDLDKREDLKADSIPFTPRGQTLIICLLPVATIGPTVLLDSGWVVFSLLTAVVLTASLWRVAVISKGKFAWYGLAVFISIQLFGTITAIARNVDDPQVQPLALIRQEDGPDEAIQGIYVTEADDRVYFATVATEGCSPELVPDSGRLLWVPKDDVVAMSIGPPQSVDEAAKTALEMSYALTPAVETPAGDHVSLTVAEKRDEAKEAERAPQERRLEDVGPAVQPSFGRGLRLTPENASPGEEVMLRMAAPNTEGAERGFGASRDGRTVRLGGVPVDIVKERAHDAGAAEYIQTVDGRPLTLEKGTLYVWGDGGFVEKDHPNVAKGGVYVKLADELAVEMNEHGPRGDSFLLLEIDEEGLPVLASGERTPEVTLENGSRHRLDPNLLRQAWHETHIRFRVPEHGTTGAISVECEQLAGQPLLRVARPPRAGISVRIRPGSRWVVFDSSRSTGHSEIATRQWLVEGVDRGKGTRIRVKMPPRTQSYSVRLKVIDDEGQTGTAALRLIRLPEHLFTFRKRHRNPRRLAEAKAELRRAIAAAPAASVEFEMRPGELPAPPNPEETIGRAGKVQSVLLGTNRAAPAVAAPPDAVLVRTLAFGKACPAERGSAVGRLDVLVLGPGVRVVPPEECPVLRYGTSRLPPP